MKKTCLFLLGLVLAFGAQAQSKIGIKLSPTLSSNRINYEGNDAAFSSDGVGGRFVFGPIYDHFITDNYSFSTGILYAPKRVGLEIRRGNTPTTESYRLQYLQIPATLKLFTNELALDTRLFFQLGGLLEVKINEQTDVDVPVVDRFQFFDVSLHLGAGVEHRLGYNTILFGGFFYNRGLINAAAKVNGLDDKLRINNDLLGLDLGVKF
ncbi:porin family protein [Cesiribacter sp. SM1]|uniref:porin family protein n=1 Tax=Cesiribacter sp. SM1 TaxID=2861196 RepID=UPI001CD76EA1|nr:porin family protein [Cesiribacter sp. SM1]